MSRTHRDCNCNVLNPVGDNAIITRLLNDSQLAGKKTHELQMVFIKKDESEIVGTFSKIKQLSTWDRFGNVSNSVLHKHEYFHR